MRRQKVKGQKALPIVNADVAFDAYALQGIW